MTKKPTRARGLGVSDKTYFELLEKQDGHCALCDSTPKTRRLHVDHDHKTGEVRALLCYRCNKAVPYWITSDWALRLFGYLKASETA